MSSRPRADEPRPGGPTVHASGRRGLLALGLVAALAFLYAWTADPTAFIGDDGGITLRYAERIATGQGFNYTDGEAVNGASSPLWTLWLAGLLAAGVDPAAAVRFSGALCFALAGALFGALGHARGGVGLGAFAAAVFWTREPNHLNAFNGLESGFTMVLVAGALLAVATERRAAIGVLLGLAVASKLDGALLALGYTAASLSTRRRFPLREALVAFGTALPVAVLLLVQFGSLLPQSAATKVLTHATPGGFDWAWMPRTLWTADRWLVLGVPLLAAAALLRGRARVVEATAVLAFLLYLGAYMAIDLGDVYPWYAVAPFQAATGCAVLFAAAAAELWGGRANGRAAQLPSLAAGLLALLLLAKSAPHFAKRYAPLPDHGALPDHALHDVPRLQAGAWLSRYAEPDERLGTYFGLPAYAYGGPVRDLTGLNSRLEAGVFADCEYFLVARGPQQPAAIASLPVVATFRASVDGPAYDLHARGDTGLGVHRACHFLVPLEAAPVEGSAGADVTAPNRIAIPAGGLYRQELDLPLLPRLEFEASAPVDVRIGWVAEPGNPRTPRTVRIEARSRRPEAAVQLENVRLRIGEPVRSTELKIRYGRWDRRTEYLAEQGYPDTDG